MQWSECRIAIRDDVRRSQAGHAWGKLQPGPVSFKLFNVSDPLPYQYRLATVREAENNKKPLFEAMPEWEIANLADGSVDGELYGGRTKYVKNLLNHASYS